MKQWQEPCPNFTQSYLNIAEHSRIDLEPECPSDMSSSTSPTKIRQPPSLREALRARKHLLLLSVLTGCLFIQPFAHGKLVGLFVYDLLLSILVVSIILAVFHRRYERVIGLFFGMTAVIGNWTRHEVVFHAAMPILLSFGFVVILRSIFEQKVIRFDDVLGAVCGYLLVGIAWGNLYILTELLIPNSFQMNTNLVASISDPHAKRFVFNYFSFVTLTTIGYGDILPTSPVAASLAWIEAMFGQFYMAVLVAQLVGLNMAQAAAQSSDGAPGAH
ncbi:MAG: hypothetical protein JWN70_2879 [Planctomycetaceae bacterium]|nr:hypothetical protein [Planctomycetaceae bacterium]